MNKELIKKYKAEFDHWLINDGNLLSKHINDENWYDAPNPSFTNVDVTYIINDEYVELRKALAEGKPVEVLHYTGYKEFDQNPWKLFAIGASTFDKPVENYRIKPEKPE